jgi:NhaP-type Na+/H+ or K+/H+ antiporter
VLVRGLVRGTDLPQVVRQALRIESGLNDIVVLPIVLVAIAFLQPNQSLDFTAWGLLSVDLLAFAPGAGVVVGLTSVASLEYVRRHVGVRRDYESLYSIGIARN